MQFIFLYDSVTIVWVRRTESKLTDTAVSSESYRKTTTTTICTSSYSEQKKRCWVFYPIAEVQWILEKQKLHFLWYCWCLNRKKIGFGKKKSSLHSEKWKHDDLKEFYNSSPTQAFWSVITCQIKRKWNKTKMTQIIESASFE